MIAYFIHGLSLDVSLDLVVAIEKKDPPLKGISYEGHPISSDNGPIKQNLFL